MLKFQLSGYTLVRTLNYQPFLSFSGNFWGLQFLSINLKKALHFSDVSLHLTVDIAFTNTKIIHLCPTESHRDDHLQSQSTIFLSICRSSFNLVQLNWSSVVTETYWKGERGVICSCTFEHVSGFVVVHRNLLIICIERVYVPTWPGLLWPFSWKNNKKGGRPFSDCY